MNDEGTPFSSKIGILSIPKPILFSILSYLRVDEVWTIRTVSKSFLNLCEDYFQEELRELVLDEQWLCTKSFGRTDHLLHICTSLSTLSINSEGPFSVQVMTVLNRISQSRCKLQGFILKGFDHNILSSPVPDMSKNLFTVEKFVLDNVYCADWRNVFSCFLQPSHRYSNLRHLTLRLPKFDGLELQYLGDMASSLTTLDVSKRYCVQVILLVSVLFQVSYCSQLKCEYLQYGLKRWSKLLSVYLCYVPSVKNTTIQVLKEYCSHLTVLCVQGTSVSVEALISLASKGVKVDVLENQLNVLVHGHNKMLLQI